jgi:putative cell wall-binding protein
MRRSAAVLVLLSLLLSGCLGGDGSDDAPSPQERAEQGTPVLGQSGDEEPAGPALGFPVFATKNTTRVGGADPVADAAAVAQAVYTSRSEDTRPSAVVLVDQDDWRAGIAAAQLAAAPLGAPVLFTEGDELPSATADALDKLRPTGAERAGDAQVIRIGDVAEPDDLKSTDIPAGNPAATARAIDKLQASAARKPAEAVVVASADRPDFAMPAAGWAAKSGDPVLWTGRDALPPETKQAIESHRKPKIYVLGPEDVISEAVVTELRKLGDVKRVSGPDPVTNAIAFSRFRDGAFGWGVTDPGHGFVFASTRRTGDAAAAAPLSTSGTYGPLLLLTEAQALPQALQDYLLDIQPGYDKDPVRGVYNHGWLMGDEAAISADVQSRIDTLLEIQPVDTGGD